MRPRHDACFCGYMASIIARVSLALREAELAAGTVAPVPGFTAESGYGFVHLKQRSLSPVALAYMAEIRAVETQFMQREKDLAVRYNHLLQ